VDRRTLEQKIGTAEARVAVIGLGSVGLPLALGFAQAGLRVVGLDIDAGNVASLKKGVSTNADVSGAVLAGELAAGRFQATDDADALAGADVTILCVPTPFSKAKQPDLSFVLNAAIQTGKHLRPEQLVILESTTYPGTTEEILQPLLEGSGLRCGEDFELAYSPERVDPGNREFGLRNTPKLVAGVTPRARDLTCALYRHVADQVVPVSTPRVAEMAKLLENTFRHVNIALVNELAVLCREMAIDIWEVIDAAATKPFGFMPFYPGPGVGGHCIPIDPFYFSWKCREHDRHARLIELAGEINDGMPDVVVERVTEALNGFEKAVRGSRILLVGLSYKKDVGDVRESPSLKVFERLMRKGAVVSYHDPYIPEYDPGTGPMRSLTLAPETVQALDCVVILTAHSGLPYEMLVRHAPIVVDTRHAIRMEAGENLFHL
jgi:UDP-N-acetyl-D-glucosamine dehydrogenase